MSEGGKLEVSASSGNWDEVKTHHHRSEWSALGDAQSDQQEIAAAWIAGMMEVRECGTKRQANPGPLRSRLS
jgi:hypothetical protein